MTGIALPEDVAVIGAGTMGHALALVHALGGCDVALYDADEEVLARAPGLIADGLATLTRAGAIDVDVAARAGGRIRRAADLEGAIGHADLVVEAVVERAGIKKALFEEIDRYAPPDAILASNTSYLDVFPLIPEARRPFAAIAHWYTPPYIVDLVDIVPGPDTVPETITVLERLYKGFGKAPLVFDDHIPGYIANRLQMALNLECLRMLDEGWVDAADIDRSIRHGLVLRLAVLGHMQKMDFTGLEMVRNGVASGTYAPPAATGRSATLDRMIAEGRTGVSAGAGFFDYGDTPVDQLYRARDERLLRLKAALSDILEGDGHDQGGS